MSGTDLAQGSGIDVLVLDIGGTVIDEHAGTDSDGALRVKLLRNVAEDLETLSRNFVITAATNTTYMSSDDVRAYLDQVDVGRYFTAIVTSFDEGAPKPDPKIVVLAARAGGAVSMARVLFVGDQPTDEEAASAAGVHFAKVDPSGLVATVEGWIRKVGS